MIQQSTAPVANRWQCVPNEYSSQNSRVSLAAGVVSFFNSLRPDYVPGSSGISVELPTLCADSPDNSGSSLRQGTELAARMVCAYACLPAGVVAYIGGLANLSAFARWLEGDPKRDDENPAQPRKKQPYGATCRQPTQLPKTAIGLGAASCLGVVGAAPALEQEHWIEVSDGSVLDKIGRDPAYPRNGSYRQLVDIDASDVSGPIGSESQPFVGQYDGGCHTITNLRHCFVQKLDGNGRIANVSFARADIIAGEKTGVVACELSGNATLVNIVLKHSKVGTDSKGAPAGLGAGIVRENALIDGFSALNCSIKTAGRESDAGGVAGIAYGTIDNTRLEQTWIETLQDNSDAGGVAGKVYGQLNNTVMIDSTVITHGSEASSGGGAGMAAFRGANIDNTVLVSTDLVAQGFESRVGGGAGVVKSGTTVANTLLINSTLRSYGFEGDAAGGGGAVHGTVINTTMIGGRAETSGRSGAQAAVGAGELYPLGRVINTTGQRVLIRTSGRFSEGAVGAAQAGGIVDGVVCFDSHVDTSGANSDAGIGAGWLSGQAVDVVANGCGVRTRGYGGDAGFGSGAILRGHGGLRNLTVVSGRVYASGRRAKEGVNGGESPFVCGSSVGDDYQSPPCCDNSIETSCLTIPKEACVLADRRVLARDCRPVVPFDIASATSTAGTAPCAMTTPSLPTTATSIEPTTVVPTIVVPTTIVPTTIVPTTVVPTTIVPTTIVPTTIVPTTVVPTTVVPTTIVPTTGVITMNVTNSTMPSLMPLSSLVPLTAPLAMKVGIGIVAGVAVLGVVGSAGHALYRYYHHRRADEGAVPFADFDDL